MNWAIIVLLILSILRSYGADQRPLLKCLGEEEKSYHLKKDSGPLYDLNQKIIAEMIQIPNAELSEENFNRVCGSKKVPASWKLLELTIAEGKQIFVIPKTLTGTQQSITEGMVEDFVDASKEILLNFITAIQTQAPTPQCLQEEIPKLSAFFTDIKYLQEDVDMKKLFEGKDLKIFESLTDYPKAFQRCRDRLKKKLKSESKAAPKKD